MINKALKNIRLYHNIKQIVLAENLGISSSYLCEIESGKKLPSIELLNKYSHEFDLPVSSLLYFSENLENEGKLAKNFRVKSAKLILKLLEWSKENEKPKQSF